MRIFSWLLNRGRGPKIRWLAANENAARKVRRKFRKGPKSAILSHVIAHRPSVTLVGRLPAVEIWNLSDPKRVALLYLQHGRKLRLPAPKALMDDAVKRARAAE
ncbi:hypothetical protein A4A58_02900 [Tardiphaga robiniae]|uniref:Uncharacterized protein n=1 Tax=Tardiphaga robiniae TaxID=943830 RepID=A0A164AW87_9BRAD|nr:hypothetical protein A4A58_02900 [Tardiphaga robiniae]